MPVKRNLERVGRQKSVTERSLPDGLIARLIRAKGLKLSRCSFSLNDQRAQFSSTDTLEAVSITIRWVKMAYQIFRAGNRS